MNINANQLPHRVKEQVIIKRDLFGNDICPDLRPTAGGSAARSGKLFEDVVEHHLKKHDLKYYKKPKFKCHFGLNREGDFEIVTVDKKIHIECKQLGDAESHFDKLSHCLLNLICGCYGKYFWLVYDYDAYILKSGKNKILKLVTRCEEIKKQVAIQGISFELILINDISATLKQYDIDIIR
jgi:hypothetical protein